MNPGLIRACRVSRCQKGPPTKFFRPSHDARCKRCCSSSPAFRQPVDMLAADRCEALRGVHARSSLLESQDKPLRSLKAMDLDSLPCRSVQFKEGGHSLEFGTLDQKTLFHRIKHWQFKSAKGRVPNVLGTLELTIPPPQSVRQFWPVPCPQEEPSTRPSPAFRYGCRVALLHV